MVCLAGACLYYKTVSIFQGVSVLQEHFCAAGTYPYYGRNLLGHGCTAGVGLYFRSIFVLQGHVCITEQSLQGCGCTAGTCMYFRGVAILQRLVYRSGMCLSCKFVSVLQGCVCTAEACILQGLSVLQGCICTAGACFYILNT